MSEKTITITVAEYNELYSAKLKLDMLKTAIFSKAYKGYSGGLCFNDIEDIVSVIFPAECTEKRVFLDMDKEEVS
jgi:ribonuclease HIII